MPKRVRDGESGAINKRQEHIWLLIIAILIMIAFFLAIILIRDIQETRETFTEQGAEDAEQFYQENIVVKETAPISEETQMPEAEIIIEHYEVSEEGEVLGLTEEEFTDGEELLPEDIFEDEESTEEAEDESFEEEQYTEVWEEDPYAEETGFITIEDSINETGQDDSETEHYKTLTAKMTEEEFGHTYGEDRFEYIVRDGCAVIVDWDNIDSEVLIPKTLGGLPVVAIAANALRWKETLTSIDIPEGVLAIGDYAFANNMLLTKVEMPRTVGYIAETAFENSEAVALAVQAESYAEYYASQIGLSYSIR